MMAQWLAPLPVQPQRQQQQQVSSFI